MKEINRILFFIATLRGGGAERVLCTLANAFSAQGKKIYIATPYNSDCAYNLMPEIVRLCILPDSYQAKGSGVFGRIRNHFYYLKRIRTLAKEVSADVVVSFITQTNNDVIQALLGSNIPVIACEHTNVLRSYSKKITRQRDLLYPFATAITVLTRHDYHIWQKKYKQVIYMPNPTSTEYGSNLVQSCERRKVVLAVATVISWYIKGLDNLLKAWAIICHRFPDWKLQIAGTCNEKSLGQLKSIVEETGCDNVEFLGFRNDIHQLMQHAAIFCLSSRMEGLPMALIEAMNSGCCCVAFDCVTGPNEIIKKNSGLLVKNQDVADLAEKLSLVMSDDYLREQLSQNAPTAVERYSLSNIEKRWQILLNKISKRLI